MTSTGSPRLEISAIESLRLPVAESDAAPDWTGQLGSSASRSPGRHASCSFDRPRSDTRWVVVEPGAIYYKQTRVRI